MLFNSRHELDDGGGQHLNALRNSLRNLPAKHTKIKREIVNELFSFLQQLLGNLIYLRYPLCAEAVKEF